MPNKPAMRPTGSSFDVVVALCIGRLRALVFERFLGVENFDRDLAFGRRTHDRSQRLRDASAAADDFAEIFRIDDELDLRLIAVFGRKDVDADGLRLAHQFLGQKDEQVGGALARAFGIGRGTMLFETFAGTGAAARTMRTFDAPAAPRPFVFGFDVVDDRFVRCDLARSERGAALRFLALFAEEAELVIERAHYVALSSAALALAFV